MSCIYCKQLIEEERLEFLTLCKRPLICKGCSNEEKISGFMDYGHKTAPQLVILPQNNKEIKRIAQRAFKRAR